ncbi:septal ring lytic transglycosylase RlpA family protein [Bisbaumannia pacifica]|uniref:Endolytic peptidoglycan transglycosylase RlpA n=1 Tax=Bisbaumannia pacifica TaxID=77098 RepID=A0A510XGI8_9GAMM|nr:septal ring lytic transglycosylase RlpA family protein [Halomonas pacifica]MBH8581805.1 septal ring lytic transglycosylase RlpA family protein [Halomonas pacifica]GEK48130.1 endolytic peptidoglycan transglycosylase RlpA [Halomonas pacifica]
MRVPFASLLILVLLLAGCAGGGGGVATSPGAVEGDESTERATGRYARVSDAYPEEPPDVSRVPDAVPRIEPRSRGGNRSPYQVWGQSYRVLDDARGYRGAGIASWYGEKFHGYATANGEIYDMYKMSAAHRSLPLPTYARVTNQANGRSVIVRVNDRGPFHEDREIDLSYAAAARLGILDAGTGRVVVEAIDPEAWLAENGRSDAPRPASTAPGQAPAAAPQAVSPEPVVAADDPVFLQVAALGSAGNAQALKVRLEAELGQPVRVASQAGIHRVQVGPLADAGRLDPLRDALRRAGFAQTLIIRPE